MSTGDPKGGSMLEMMIAAIASVALRMATIATFVTMAVAHGGVGRGGHFGGFGGHFAGGHWVEALGAFLGDCMDLLEGRITVTAVAMSLPPPVTFGSVTKTG